MMAAEVRYLRNDNCGYRSMDYAVKYDTQVTPEDIRDYNLILWGNNKTHALIAKINSQLPVKLDGHKVIAGETIYDYDDVALAMIYPNPLNRERYVMIYSGNVWLARGSTGTPRRGPSTSRALSTISRSTAATRICRITSYSARTTRVWERLGEVSTASSKPASGCRFL